MILTFYNYINNVQNLIVFEDNVPNFISIKMIFIPTSMNTSFDILPMNRQYYDNGTCNQLML